MNTKLPHIVNALSKLHTQLKAEVAVSAFKEQANIAQDQIVVRHRGSFKRAYEEDILSYKLAKEKNNQHIEISLSRNGIYDRLPEGLFHKTAKTNTKKEFGSFRRQQKQEQEDARLLFAPIENAFFRTEVATEEQRKKQISHTTSLEDGFLYNFWGIPKNFPKAYAAPLIRLLPHAKNIAGNLEQTFYALELLLGIKVSYSTTFIDIPKQKKKTDHVQLGVNFLLEAPTTIKGNYQKAIQNKPEDNAYQVLPQPALEVVLHPNHEDGIPKCIEEEGLLQIASVFYDYFLPLEYNVTTKIDVAQTQGFIVDKQKGAYLGMSTLLGA
ncbi:hypothetical protein [uncultured Maribacter sp.]|uniref:hypothetical protein n=1 Tax=uncultured Maribacter sp. TaxID=431308 RepID=UPI00260C64E3|nr:hypothetical protein [uncultured Maribacter sp.]